MNIAYLQLRPAVVCFLATILLTSGVAGDATPDPKSSQAADRTSNYYLLLEDESLYSNQPYQTEVQKIHHLGRAKDLTGLARLADDIEQTWGHQIDTRGYFALMDVVTSVLNSDNFGPDIASLYKQDELTQKYVLATLAHGTVPLDITATLLPRLIFEEELTLYKRPFSEADWAQLRKYRAPLWLQTRQRLKQSVIPDYDFTSPVYISFPFNPESLKDPKQAAAHNKAIEDNSRKMRGRNAQSLVRFQDKLFSPMAESEIVSYYSHPPYDPQELKRLLDTYVEDTATKQSILNQVAKNITTASEKATKDSSKAISKPSPP